jgi:hypothetical protein
MIARMTILIGKGTTHSVDVIDVNDALLKKEGRQPTKNNPITSMW